MALGECGDGCASEYRGGIVDRTPCMHLAATRFECNTACLNVHLAHLTVPYVRSDLDKLCDTAKLNAEDRAAVYNLNALDVAVTTDQHRQAKDFTRKKRNSEGGKCGAESG